MQEEGINQFLLQDGISLTNFRQGIAERLLEVVREVHGLGKAATLADRNDALLGIVGILQGLAGRAARRRQSTKPAKGNRVKRGSNTKPMDNP